MRTPRSARPTFPTSQTLTGSLTLQTPLGAVLGSNRIRLLEAIDRCGSLNRAAREVPLSYKAAWDALDTLNKLAPEPLVERSTGGTGGGGTRLTDYARQVIRLYRAMESSQQDVLDRLGPVPADTEAPALRTLLRRMTMKTSARNQLQGRVNRLVNRAGLVDVVLTLAGAKPGNTDAVLIATITPDSVEDMALQPGSEVWALFKAPMVQIVADPPPDRPGWNALAGKVSALRPGEGRVGVTLALPGECALQASLHHTAAEALTLGQQGWAVLSGEQVILVAFD
ncbi:TOBE domain-containing protein [Sphaerotilus sp.]|uniref:TOBE domain-containing protein n=1 Tax=Sphaerotilus sp. TaxID=2093942 RepID=UPI0034E1E4B9